MYGRARRRQRGHGRRAGAAARAAQLAEQPDQDRAQLAAAGQTLHI